MLDNKGVPMHPTLEDLGYPEELEDLFAIRRKLPEDVQLYLIDMMRRGDPPENAQRLPRDSDYFYLPYHLNGAGIEIIGTVRNLPKFVRIEDGEEGEEPRVLVEYGEGLVLLYWTDPETDEETWFMIPPGPEPLREDAELPENADHKQSMLELADWIERIPLSERITLDD